MASPKVLFADTRDLMRPAPRRGAARARRCARRSRPRPSWRCVRSNPSSSIALACSKRSTGHTTPSSFPMTSRHTGWSDIPTSCRTIFAATRRSSCCSGLTSASNRSSKSGEGRLYFFIATDDLAAGRLDRARLGDQQVTGSVEASQQTFPCEARRHPPQRVPSRSTSPSLPPAHMQSGSLRRPLRSAGRRRLSSRAAHAGAAASSSAATGGTSPASAHVT